MVKNLDDVYNKAALEIVEAGRLVNGFLRLRYKLTKNEADILLKMLIENKIISIENDGEYKVLISEEEFINSLEETQRSKILDLIALKQQNIKENNKIVVNIIDENPETIEIKYTAEKSFTVNIFINYNNSDIEYNDNVRAWANVLCENEELYHFISNNNEVLDIIENHIFNNFKYRIAKLCKSNYLLIGIVDNEKITSQYIRKVLINDKNFNVELKTNQIVTQSGTLLSFNFDLSKMPIYVKNYHNFDASVVNLICIEDVKVAEINNNLRFLIKVKREQTDYIDMMLGKCRVTLTFKDKEGNVINSCYAETDGRASEEESYIIDFLVLKYYSGKENYIELCDYVD